MNELAVRIRAFEWLQEKNLINAGVFSFAELQKGFTIEDKIISLVGPTGIWIPKGFKMPISIRTSEDGPYPDEMSSDGILTYKYRGSDPNHRDNRGLRDAHMTMTQLIYFKSISKGRYNAYFPVIVIGDNAGKLEVKVDLTPSAIQQSSMFESESVGAVISDDNLLRRYSVAMIRQRMHQSAFRERVITAYRRQCTICGIKHEELLDAAHIVPDKDVDGHPIFSNGLSLCKIHHASFDKLIIGISPDYEIKVRDDVLEEKDGDMLKYGLQRTNGKSIILPQGRQNYPDKDRLEKAYQRFLRQ
ncbi:MAG: HNH endonuclease [Ignavibacteria bacterium]|nr:HNH endonuclease [Ignavibacteria bacterium]